MGNEGNIPRLYTIIAEMMACASYFLLLQRRKSNFHIFLITVALFGVELVYLEISKDMPLFLWPCHMLVLILMMYGYLKLCIQATVRMTIYYTLKAFLFAEFMASFEWQFSYYFQWSELFSVPSQFIIAVLVYFICCLLFWKLEKWEQRESGLYEISPQELLIASAITIAVFVMSNFSFFVENSPFSGSGLFDMFNIRTLFDLMGLVVIYAFQRRILDCEMKADMASMEAALRDQYNKYRNYQDDIELIHLKYHDLKHQLEDLRGSVHEDGQRLLIDHIESELKEYRPQLDTGNAVLNALLDSRRVLCQRKGITVTAVADGKLLSFLSTADMCTIIGNALDNAVECVSEIEDPQKRLIHLEVTSNKGFVLVRVDNPIERPVQFAYGLPRSERASVSGHGLGTRSIQRTVDRLGGNAVFECVNDSFVLRIIFPVSGRLSR